MQNVNNRRRYALEAVVLGMLCIAVFAPWGCSPAPLAPAPGISGQTFELPNGIIAVPGRLLDQTEPAEPGTFERIPLPFGLDTTVTEITSGDVFGPFVEDISSGGGTIVLDVANDTSYFTVPELGLKSVTEISISIVRDQSQADVRITEFHFAPEGLKFDVPAELSYASSLADGEVLFLYWWDEAQRDWMKSAEAPVVKGYATFPITHFSKYRTTEKISLGGQQ